MFALSLQHLWFAPDLLWQRIELRLAGVSNFTPSLALSWRYAPAHCLTIRAGIQRLVCCISGFLNPASKLDAGGSDGVSRLHPSPSLTRVDLRTFGFYLVLSHYHAVSSPVLSPRAFWPCLVTTLHIAVHALCRLPCQPTLVLLYSLLARSHLSGMAAP